MFCIINLIGPYLNTALALVLQHVSAHPFILSQCWQLCSLGQKETTNVILGYSLWLSLKLSPRSSGTEVIIPLLPLGITHKGRKNRGNVWSCHPLPLSRKESSWYIWLWVSVSTKTEDSYGISYKNGSFLKKLFPECLPTPFLSSLGKSRQKKTEGLKNKYKLVSCKWQVYYIHW